MRLAAIAIALVVALGTANAQRHKLVIIGDSPEGQLLTQIGNEPDQAKKLALMEDFLAKYPKHESAGWVYDQIVPAYAGAGQPDKALEAGEKAIAADPEDLDVAHACLKAAEAKKDPDLVLKWSNTTSEIARKLAKSQPPADADPDDWKKRVDYARQVDIYTEYALYAAALGAADPKKKIMLGDALEKRNPESQYLAQMAEPRFQAYMQAGEAAKAMELAEKTVEKDQSNADMLLAVADSYRAKKQAEKVAEYSKKAIDVAATKPKPEGVSEPDWQMWRSQITGRAHWLLGLAYAGESKWALADKDLRASLPGVKTSREMTAEALFYLGVANYELGRQGQTDRIADAVRFSEECAAIPGRFQTQARTNVKAMRAQYRVR